MNLCESELEYGYFHIQAGSAIQASVSMASSNSRSATERSVHISVQSSRHGANNPPVVMMTVVIMMAKEKKINTIGNAAGDARSLTQS
ncbi:hypothetical protein PoB_006359000 [Plakobranchus ocellatus]|uniref:Uncharacterized protein n=1 Tax=Plakobranchus ocellatus TaxID=259542 RepID=A0AAV4CZ47_9GAST|nr:hypothetical protein PoB_006359000 [Plakobranchus ocellatus]